MKLNELQASLEVHKLRLKVFDTYSRLILKASLSYNMTFKFIINVLDHQSLALTNSTNMNWTYKLKKFEFS